MFRREDLDAWLAVHRITFARSPRENRDACMRIQFTNTHEQCWNNTSSSIDENVVRCCKTRVSQDDAIDILPKKNSAEIEAMRSGRLHVAGFSTGPTGFAVNMAGAVPFATKGTGSEVQGYQLFFLVKRDSPFQKLADLKAALARLPGTEPVKGVLELRTTRQTVEDRKPVVTRGHSSARVEDGPQGLRMAFAREDLQKAAEIGRAHV